MSKIKTENNVTSEHSSSKGSSTLLLEGQECNIESFQEKSDFTSLRNFEGDVYVSCVYICIYMTDELGYIVYIYKYIYIYAFGIQGNFVEGDYAVSLCFL